MRVAYVSMDPGVPAFGVKGCSVHVQEGLRALARHGLRPALFTARLGGPPPADLAHVPVHALPCLPEAAPDVRERATLSANTALAAHLPEHEPFDLIYERYALWSFAAMEHGRAAGLPTVLEVNAPLIDEQAQHRHLVDVDGATAASRRAFAAADALIAVSEGVADWLDGFAEARGRIHVVPNGVDADRVRPGLDPAWTASDGTFVIGFVGSLKPWHGLSVLAEAFARLHRAAPEARLLLVGDGPEREPLTAQLHDLGVQDAVQFAGAVPPNEVPRWLAAINVAVAPYADATACYFSPLKIFEYMAAGRAIVASRVGQVAEVLDHEATALLVEAGAAKALAEALDRLRCDPLLRLRLGTTARATVLMRHTWTAVFQHVLALVGLAAMPDNQREAA
ncbi:MAG: glycosyltransferase [Rhodothermaceae bacterium]|nr:glycosyltransferase [Rhodothermaceae bacterium]